MQNRLVLPTLLLVFSLFFRGQGNAVEDGHGQEGHECDAKQTFGTAGRLLQERLLANLARQTEFPLALCFAPDTPREVIDAYHSALPLDAFRIHPTSSRWTSTATDGSGIGRGVPITLTWSFLADGVAIGGYAGEPAAPSNLIAFLNGIYGNQTNWMPLFEQVFSRWSELSGITFVFEPNDDSAEFPGSSGVLGVRGDIRIGGHFIDGESNTLAYNFFPNTGDMVIDTGDNNFYGNTANNSLRLRNVLAHEVGHGLGFQHVCPANETKLMEPFISTSYNGPQHDDIRAVHRNYGDPYGLNNTVATAVSLGLLGNQSMTVTNASIDGAAEVDFFSFTVSGSNKRANVTLTPIGATYLEGAQNGDGTCSAGTTFNSKAVIDLGFELLDSNGTSVLVTANDNPAGQNETATNIVLDGAGPFYVRVFGNSIDDIQLYEIAISIVEVIPDLAAPVLAAEPSITPGTENTIFWNAVQPGSLFENSSLSVAGTTKAKKGGVSNAVATLSGSSGESSPASATLPPEQSQVANGASDDEKEASPDISFIWQGIFTETFEGAFPGSNWTRYGNPTWDDTNFDSHNGSWSGWCGASSLNPANGYANDMQSWMVYGPFDLSDAAGARVNFWYKNDSEATYDRFMWLASTNGSQFFGQQVSGDQNSWRPESFDLSNVYTLGNLTGKSEVWIAFYFESDDSYSGEEGYMGAYVDDIVIEKDVINSEPDLTPYKPVAWNDKLPIGKTQSGINDAHTYSGAFYDHQTLYFNWASINQGNGPASEYTARVEVTGTGGGAWTWNIPSHAPDDWYGLSVDQAVGPLSAGEHTFKLWVDYNDAITETNETNNYYERTITVTTAPPIEYFAESATNSNFLVAANSGWISATEFTFTNLTPGQDYWYRVKAKQGTNESEWSNVVSSQQDFLPVIGVSPNSHSFGTIRAGETVDRTFVVTNAAGGIVSGNATATLPFSILSGGSYSLSAGQSQAVVVRYNPLAAGTHNENVIFSGGGGSTNQVSGSATNAADLFHSVFLTNEQIQFTLEGEAGITYVLQYSTNLVTWSNLALLTNSTGSVVYTDDTTNSAARFYRSLRE